MIQNRKIAQILESIHIKKHEFFDNKCIIKKM